MERRKERFKLFPNAAAIAHRMCFADRISENIVSSLLSLSRNLGCAVFV